MWWPFLALGSPQAFGRHVVTIHWAPPRCHCSQTVFPNFYKRIALMQAGLSIQILALGDMGLMGWVGDIEAWVTKKFVSVSNDKMVQYWQNLYFLWKELNVRKQKWTKRTKKNWIWGYQWLDGFETLNFSWRGVHASMGGSFDNLVLAQYLVALRLLRLLLTLLNNWI